MASKTKKMPAMPGKTLSMGQFAAGPKDVDEDDMIEGYPKHEIHNAADTMLRAHEIMQDPKKHAAVMKHLNKTKSTISSLGQLRQVYQKKFGAE